MDCSWHEESPSRSPITEGPLSLRKVGSRSGPPCLGSHQPTFQTEDHLTVVRGWGGAGLGPRWKGCWKFIDTKVSQSHLERNRDLVCLEVRRKPAPENTQRVCLGQILEWHVPAACECVFSWLVGLVFPVWGKQVELGTWACCAMPPAPPRGFWVGALLLYC